MNTKTYTSIPLEIELFLFGVSLLNKHGHIVKLNQLNRVVRAYIPTSKAKIIPMNSTTFDNIVCAEDTVFSQHTPPMEKGNVFILKHHGGTEYAPRLDLFTLRHDSRPLLTTEGKELEQRLDIKRHLDHLSHDIMLMGILEELHDILDIPQPVSSNPIHMAGESVFEIFQRSHTERDSTEIPSTLGELDRIYMAIAAANSRGVLCGISYVVHLLTRCETLKVSLRHMSLGMMFTTAWAAPREKCIVPLIQLENSVLGNFVLTYNKAKSEIQPQTTESLLATCHHHPEFITVLRVFQEVGYDSGKFLDRLLPTTKKEK